MTRIVLIALALAGCTPASWSRTDTAVEASIGALMVADYLQTRQIVVDGMESNPVMGERGERMPPAVYFPAAAVAHLATARCLPRPWREVFQGVTIGWQLYAIRDNWSAGYEVGW